MAGKNDITIVGWAQTPAVRRTDSTETQLCLEAVVGAIETAGVSRKEIGFTCSGSCDYLTGGPFAFVSNLEAAGAWPPISESHVEMDGAWALYEAWVRLQQGDIDVALVVRLGQVVARRPGDDLSAADSTRTSSTPLGARSGVARRAAGPGAARLGHGDRARLRRGRRPQPAQRARATRTPRCAASSTSTRCSPSRTGREPLRVTTSRRSPTAQLRSCSPPPTRPRQLTERPGVDPRHRPSHRGAPAGLCVTSPVSTLDDARRRRRRGRRRRRRCRSPSCRASFSPQEIILREALGLGDDVEVNPSGGALAANPMMATGLIRIIEAASQIAEAAAATGRSPTRPTAKACNRTSSAILEGSSMTAPSLAVIGVGQTKHSKARARRVDAGPRPRGRPARARRRRARLDRHRRGRDRQGARHVRGRDAAGALPRRRARRGRQADAPRAHRRQRRRLDRDRGLPPRHRRHPRASPRRRLGEAVRGQRAVGPRRRQERRHGCGWDLRPVDASVHQRSGGARSTSAGWSR